MDTSVSDTKPTFSRLTEGKARHSWRAAVPAVVFIVAVVALIAFLASKLSTYSQKASAAERDANQYREQQTALTKQIGDLQKEVTLARSPGRTTVILESAQVGKKGAAPTAKSWAAVTWGELPTGKSWMRVNGYGLSQSLDGNKAYHVWMEPQSGDPVDIGALEIDQNGSGFALKSDLPAIDQGKALMLTADAQDAKTHGDVLAKADLPKLQSTMQQMPPAQAQSDQAKAPAESQGKSSTDTQQMHQSGK
jgi:type II secretory pathway pseudopilin PulG